MKLALFGRKTDIFNLRKLNNLIHKFKEHENVKLCFYAPFYESLKENGFTDEKYPLFTSFSDLPEDLNLFLSLGGDGTFLHTAARVGDKGIPVLGINTGHLGFLADLSGNDIENDIQAIIEGKYKVEERTLLQVEADGLDGMWNYALNEVAILKQDSASMISVRTTINDEYFNTYQADGLIIATPTGSTAYALSAGGPVLVPQAANWVLAPVAPHSFTVRPLVVNDDVTISLQVSCRTGKFLLSCDGRSVQMPAEQIVTLRKAPFTIKVVKGNNHSFSQTLRNKLMWGVDKRD